MKTFNCADIVPDCDFVFRGLDHAGIVERAAEHAADRHGVNVDHVFAQGIRDSVSDC